MLAAEVLFTQSLKSTPQTANERAPWDPVFAEECAERSFDRGALKNPLAGTGIVRYTAFAARGAR
jgi:hypothetical protein